MDPDRQPAPAGDAPTSTAELRDADHLRIEEELRRTRDRLAEAQRLARLGSWEWDIVANEVIWSDELYRIYGLVPGELEPSYESFLERVHPDDRDDVDARNRKAFADHQPFEDVKRCVRPDGEVFLMRTKGEVITDADGNPIRMIGVCEDVTPETDANEARAALAAVVLSSNDAIVATDEAGVISTWNPGAEELYGYTDGEIVGRDYSVLLPPDLRGDDEENRRRLAAGERIEHFETLALRRDGSVKDISLTMSPVLEPEGRLVGISLIARDITEQKRFQERLKRLANEDPITGLCNRHRFEDALAARVEDARRYGDKGAVLLLDLDDFKHVNDTLGHGAGDELLRGIAALLRGRLRRTDVLARVGGDEFAVLLDRAGQDEVRGLAVDLIALIRKYRLSIDGVPVQVTASAGAVTFGASVEKADDVLAAADRAMYRSKDAGRDRSTIEALDQASSPKYAGLWERRIREALDHDGFELHLQPILDLASNRVDSYEVLLRMRSDEGLLLPGAFLGAAERLGLVHAIDSWVVVEAIKTLASDERLRLSVNLSARSVDDDQVFGLIRSQLRKRGVEPERLVLEITETAAIENMDDARSFAAALRELGCSLALDDFGAGFASFYYLKRLPADFLKIDGDFIRGPRSDTDELVIRAIVDIARGLGKRTVAEFVENADDLAAVRAHRVDFAQGFHIGRPRPLAEVMSERGEAAAGHSTSNSALS